MAFLQRVVAAVPVTDIRESSPNVMNSVNHPPSIHCLGIQLHPLLSAFKTSRKLRTENVQFLFLFVLLALHLPLILYVFMFI